MCFLRRQERDRQPRALTEGTVSGSLFVIVTCGELGAEVGVKVGPTGDVCAEPCGFFCGLLPSMVARSLLSSALCFQGGSQGDVGEERGGVGPGEERPRQTDERGNRGCEHIPCQMFWNAGFSGYLKETCIVVMRVVST